MVLMMHPTIMASGLILMPSITALYAKQDAWIAPIIASAIGYLNVLLVYQLNKRYPGMTIVEYSQRIVGRIPGKIVGLILIFFYVHANGTIIREYGEFIHSSFLFHTPMAAIIGSMLVVCAFAVRGGLEVIARCAQLVEMFLFISLVATFSLLIPDFSLSNLLPVMEHGPAPSLKGAVVSSSFYSYFLLLAFVLPHLSEGNKGMKWGLYAVHLAVPTFVMLDLVPLLLYGGITGSLTYPLISAIRYISIGEMFDHLEAVVMAIYVGGVFIKISVFFYAVVLGAAQWLGMSDYRPIVFPLALLLFSVSLWSVGSLQELSRYFATTRPFYALTVQTLIPVLLLAVALLRRQSRTSAVRAPP